MSARPPPRSHWTAACPSDCRGGRGRQRPFWSRERGRAARRQRGGSADPPGSPLPAMAAPLGTGTRTEEPGQEKQDAQEKAIAHPERAEEAKLKAKYPNLGQKPGGSDFLMKRLQKGQKYFDSGDYNMAKAKMKNKQLPSAGPDKNLVTGDHIPTPQDLPQRKSSLVTSKLAG